MDNYDDHLETTNMLAQKVNLKEAKIGVHFMQEELLNQLSNKSKATATKISRLNKWRDMITYGLDPEYRDKVFKETPAK